MKIETNIKGNYTELKLDGRLDTNSSLILEKELMGIIEQGNKNILINLEELNYINSSGLRVFLAAAKLLDSMGEKLNICCVKDYIKEVFEIAGFSSIFHIQKTADEIIKQ